jgi:preprotein translocase subunit SecG
MENILLTLNIIFAIILIILILFQKSEGGALGIGVSQDSFMFSRSAGNFFTKATAIIATLFIICSLSLTIIGRQDLPTSTSVIDKIEEKEDDSLPKIPKNNN